MANFSTKQGFLLVPSNKLFEELKYLDKFYFYSNNYPKRLCGYSGYGVYKNYKFLNDHKVENYLKFQ